MTTTEHPFQAQADATRDTSVSRREIEEILAGYYERWSRAGRLDEQLFTDLENRLLPLIPGQPVMFQRLGQRRWLRAVFEGPVDNPADPQRWGDVWVRTPAGRREQVFLSGVRRVG